VGRTLRAGGAARPWLVALTGCARPEEREQALAAGFDAHTAKPASLEEIERHLRSASTWRKRLASQAEVPRRS
jgi:CheY-like chemotaxis protein